MMHSKTKAQPKAASPLKASGIRAGSLNGAAIIFGSCIFVITHTVLNTLNPAETRAASLIDWSPFAWWLISGTVAAFTGGWMAGALAAATKYPDGGTHGFLSWAFAMLMLVAGAGLSIGTPLSTSPFFAPISIVVEQITAHPERTQSMVARMTLLSFIFILAGAVVSTLGGRRGGPR